MKYQAHRQILITQFQILLVFISLALFLNIRLAFWVAFGIPIAFMGEFMVLSGFDQTINLFSRKMQKPAVGGRTLEVGMRKGKAR
jgi:hypothetical protein